MRTLMVVGLVVGPVLVLGAPVALTRGAAPLPLPPWAAYGAFVLAGVAAVGGIALLILSFRRPRTRSAPAPAALPVGSVPAPREPLTPTATATATATVPGADAAGAPRRVGSRYVATEPLETPGPAPRIVFCHPRGADDPDPQTTPSLPSLARSRYVTLRTRRQPARTSVTAG